MEPHTGLNVVDYSVFGVILLSGLLALMRGFVREVLSLLAWAGAYFVAANYYKLAEPWTKDWMKGNESASSALAAVIVFIASLVVFTILGYLVAKVIRGRALTAIDRSLGFLFGLARGALICCLLYLGALYIPWLNVEKLDKSASPPQIEVARSDLPAGPDDKSKERKKDDPPEWLINAKTRPALAYGANILKDFIPQKAIEKSMQAFDAQKANAHRVIDEKTEDIISNPSHLIDKKEEKNPYDNQDRSNLDQLIGEKNKP